MMARPCVTIVLVSGAIDAVYVWRDGAWEDSDYRVTEIDNADIEDGVYTEIDWDAMLEDERLRRKGLL